ncbi:unnamed protein product, partial [Ixodes pacificus]
FRSYKCKHIVAMLLYIHTTKVFEILSSTDLPQQWGKSQKQGVKDKYAPRPIIELPCVKRIKTASDASLEEDVLGKLLQGLPYRSAAHRHREKIPLTYIDGCASLSLCEGRDPCHALGCLGSLPRVGGRRGSSQSFQCIEPEEPPSPPQRPATLTEALRMMSRNNQASDDGFYEALQEMFSKAVVEEIATLTIQQAESPLWMEYRTGLISASVAYSVYTRVKTLRTKMGPHDLRPLFKVLMRESTFQSSAMARGSQDESTAKRKYLQESTHANLTIQDSGLLIMESEPCVGASPDGIVTCDCCERRLIEVKCTDGMQGFKSREMMKNSDNHMLKKTSRYYCQVQVQMGIAQIRSTDFFVYQDEHTHILFSVHFDEVFFRDVVERAVFFFKEYMIPLITAV